jgi:hypothetical protein
MREPYRRGDAVGARGVARLGAGVLLAALLVLLLGALTLFQATAAGTARPALRRATAALTEIDALIGQQYDELRLRAESAGPGESLRLENYPLPVDLPAEEVLGSSPESLRASILDRSAGLLYDDGTAALRDPEAGDGTGAFSVAGATDRFIGALRQRNHDALLVAVVVLAAMCAAGALGVTLTARGFGRLGGVGIALLAAGAAYAVAGGAVRWYAAARTDGADGEYLRRELFAIAEEFARIPIRDGLAFAALGAVFCTTALVCGALGGRRAAAAATT